MGNSQSDYADFVKASGETQHHKTEKKYLMEHPKIMSDPIKKSKRKKRVLKI